VVPQFTSDVPQFVPGINYAQYTAAPASQTFDGGVGQALDVNPSHLGYLPPSLQQQFPHPPHDTNVHVPGKINCFQVSCCLNSYICVATCTGYNFSSEFCEKLTTTYKIE
jgi:hypothetical protein